MRCHDPTIEGGPSTGTGMVAVPEEEIVFVVASSGFVRVPTFRSFCRVNVDKACGCHSKAAAEETAGVAGPGGAGRQAS